MHLTDSQQAAYDGIIKDASMRSTLFGAAGTGKSTLISELFRYYTERKLRVLPLAPTHQAKKVLSNMLRSQALTIHKGLGLKPLTEREFLEFSLSGVKDGVPVQSADIVIIDEVSMVSDELYATITRFLKPEQKLIGVGDPHQLPPIDNNDTISPFFLQKQFKKYELTEIVRTNNTIVDVADRIKNGQPFISEDKDVIKCFNAEELLDIYKTYVKTPEDCFTNRIVAYTNKSVNYMNEIVRLYLYNDTSKDKYISGEYLVLQDPVFKDEQIVCNNGDIVQVTEFFTKKKIITSSLTGKEMNIEFDEILTEIIDGDYEGKVTLRVLSSEYEQPFGEFLSFWAHAIKNATTGNKKLMWEDFWRLKHTFVTVKYLPASTIHKSQGITVENIFIHSQHRRIAGEALNKQLLYVAVTRAKNKVYFV